MPQTLTITLSDAAMARRAAERGTTPEAFLAEELTRGAEDSSVSQFLVRWAGAVRADVGDWADDHDRHLGAAQSAERNVGPGDADVR